MGSEGPIYISICVFTCKIIKKKEKNRDNAWKNGGLETEEGDK